VIYKEGEKSPYPVHHINRHKQSVLQNMFSVFASTAFAVASVKDKDEHRHTAQDALCVIQVDNM
jgi:hypothetical protein